MSLTLKSQANNKNTKICGKSVKKAVEELLYHLSKGCVLCTGWPSPNDTALTSRMEVYRKSGGAVAALRMPRRL